MEAVLQQNLAVTVRRERRNLLRYIRSRISSSEDAEDILQDVLLQAVRSLSVTEPIDNLLAWLYTAARNRIIDWYRRKRFATLSLDSADDRVSLQELIAASGIDVEKDVIRTAIMESLLESLEELPAPQREIFMEQAIEGHTFREIAERTGVSINTLIARKRYAVQFLRKRLADMRDIINELG
jgi:RNA polymerase sigma factor (sigma-70 family)